MSQRKVLKEIIQFGKREFKEKKPLSLEILRIKSKTILKRGVLPTLTIKQIRKIRYLIVVDYKESLRIYSFNSNGLFLGGTNLENTPKLQKLLKKDTVKEYTLPRKLPKITIGDISVHYQEQFDKAQRLLNNQFGLNIKYPLSIVADKNLKEVNVRGFGVQKDNKFLKIDDKYCKTPMFDAIIYRELIYHFMERKKLLPKNSDLIYDFCYFIIAILKRGEKTNQVFELMESFPLILKDFNLKKDKNFLLKLINESYEENELEFFLLKIFSTIKLLNIYKILIDSEEFQEIFISFYHGVQKKYSNF